MDSANSDAVGRGSGGAGEIGEAAKRKASPAKLLADAMTTGTGLFPVVLFARSSACG